MFIYVLMRIVTASTIMIMTNMDSYPTSENSRNIEISKFPPFAASSCISPVRNRKIWMTAWIT